MPHRLVFPTLVVCFFPAPHASVALWHQAHWALYEQSEAALATATASATSQLSVMADVPTSSALADATSGPASLQSLRDGNLDGTGSTASNDRELRGWCVWRSPCGVSTARYDWAVQARR